MFLDNSMALPWFFVSCVMFIGNIAFQNDSQKIALFYNETVVFEHVLSVDILRKNSCSNRCLASRLSLLDCACDENCLFFGDCCKDYLYYCSANTETSNKSLAASISHQLSLTDTTKPRWSCITNTDSTQPSSEGILAVASCPPSWSFKDIRRKCEVRGTVREELVYDDTGYVYANQFCAICNMDVIVSDNNTTESGSTFSLCASSSESTTNCLLEFLVEVSEKAIELRPCSLQLVDTCPHDRPEQFVFGCGAFVDVILAGADMYKNNMCLNCIISDGPADLPVYTVLSNTSNASANIVHYVYQVPFIEIFNVSPPSKLERKVKCIENEYYDEVTTKCQRCDNGTIVSESEYISILNNNVFYIALLGDLAIASSHELGLTEGNSSGINEEDNHGLVDEEMNVCITSCTSKNIGPDDPVDDGHSDEGWVTLAINESKLSCRVLRKNPVNVMKIHKALLLYNKTLTIVNVTVCTISLVALLISILTLCCFRSLLNLPGICRLCLMMSLFLAQFIMLTIAYVTKPEILCIVTAAFMHFFWLAMFLWTNVLAFDLARVFGTQSPPSTINKRLLLGFYMLYGWGLPAVVIVSCITLHFSGKFDFRYGGERFCWFSNHGSLLYAFAIPVAVCIVFNFVLYLVTVFGIWKVRRVSEFAVKENERVKKRKDELKLYIKLSILMGLTWSLVFIAVYSNEIIVWYLFIILNGLQGFFIFIAFTCNRQTLAKWKEAYATRFEVHSSSRVLTTTTSVKTQPIT